eukprot:2206202-Rhodomonas_salina.1
MARNHPPSPGRCVFWSKSSSSGATDPNLEDSRASQLGASALRTLPTHRAALSRMDDKGSRMGHRGAGIGTASSRKRTRQTGPMTRAAPPRGFATSAHRTGSRPERTTRSRSARPRVVSFHFKTRRQANQDIAPGLG